jgi:hypothetical protein
MTLKDALRATFKAEDHVLPDKQKYDPRICQCCGYFRKRDEDPECVCDGLNWHMDKFGHVECEAHRFARVVGKGRTVFGMRR